MGGEIRIATGAVVHRVPAATHLKPDFVSCHHSGVLPEVVVVCANLDCMTENKSA